MPDDDYMPPPGEPAGEQTNAATASQAKPDDYMPPPTEPSFEPEAAPTRWSQVQRTPEYFTSAPQDMGEEVYNTAVNAGHHFHRAYDLLSQKTDNWLDFFRTKGAGALHGLGGVGAAMATPTAWTTPLIAHTAAGATHFAGSLYDPEQASLDVADTFQQPYQGDPSHPNRQVGWKDVLLPAILGGDLNPAPQGGPRGLVSAWRPAAEVSQLLSKPQQTTPRGLENVPPSEFSSEDIFRHGDKQYKYIRGLGGKFDEDRLADVADNIQAVLHQDGFPRADNKALWRNVDRLRHLDNPSFSDIDAIRRAINNNARESPRAAAIARTGIDDFWRNVTAADMTANPQVAPLLNDAIHSARQNWTQGSKLETLENFKEAAELGEGKAIGHSDLNRSLVNAATTMLQPKNKRVLRGWSDDEVAALRKISQGSLPQKLTAWWGSMAPTMEGGIATGLKDLAHAAATYWSAPVGVPVTGSMLAAKTAAKNQTLRNWQALEGMIAKTTPAYEASRQLVRPAIGRSALPAALMLSRKIAGGG